MADDRLGGRRAPRDTTGRVPFVWVEDTSTGHRYDVLETALRPGMTPVKGVDKNYTGRARPTKYRTDKAGNPTTSTAGTADADAGTTRGGQK
jgi:hypothetical protein